MKLLAQDQEDGSVAFEWAGEKIVARLERDEDGSWWLRRHGRHDVFVQPAGVLQPANRTQAHGMVSTWIADKLSEAPHAGTSAPRSL